MDIVKKVMEWCKHYDITDFWHSNTLTMGDLFPPATLSPTALSPARENVAIAFFANAFHSAFESSTKGLSTIIEEEAGSSLQNGRANDADISNNNSGGNNGGDGDGDGDVEMDMDMDMDGANYDTDSFTYEDSASLHASAIEPDTDDDKNSSQSPLGDSAVAHAARIDSLFGTLSPIDLVRFPDWDIAFFGTLEGVETIRCVKEAAKQLGIEVLYRRCLGAEVAEERGGWEVADKEMGEMGERMEGLGV